MTFLPCIHAILVNNVVNKQMVTNELLTSFVDEFVNEL